MILQNSRTIPGQKALFSIPGVFQDQGQIQGLFQVRANPFNADAPLEAQFQESIQFLYLGPKNFLFSQKIY